MSAAAILTRLQDLGVSVHAADGLIHMRPASVIPPELLADVRAHKPELLTMLAAGAALVPTLAPASPEEAVAQAADAAAACVVAGLPMAPAEQHDAETAALQHAASQRRPSWPGGDRIPTVGCRCSCCGGSHWWREREHASGWRCWTCHPSAHLAADQVVEVHT